MKKILFSCLSLGLVMMLWAFTLPKEKAETSPKLAPIWFYYDGTGSEFEQQNYTTTPPAGNCSGSSNPCGVYVEPDAGNSAIPDQDALDAAASSSSDFNVEVSGLVDLKS